MKILLFLLLPLASVAHQPERGKVTAFTGPIIYKTEFESPVTNSPYLGGFALVALGDVDKNGGIEISLMYLHKHYYRVTDNHSIGEKRKRLYIPLGYRHWFNSSFSIAGAFYSSYAMGDVSIVHSTFPAGQEISTSAQKTVEYGFDYSLQWEALKYERFSIVIDARYSYSLSARDNEDANHRGLIIGYKQNIN